MYMINDVKYSVGGSGIDAPFSNGTLDDVIDAILSMKDGAIIVAIDEF